LESNFLRHHNIIIAAPIIEIDLNIIVPSFIIDTVFVLILSNCYTHHTRYSIPSDFESWNYASQPTFSAPFDSCSLFVSETMPPYFQATILDQSYFE
jgi:hypothetical protein